MHERAIMYGRLTSSIPVIYTLRTWHNGKSQCINLRCRENLHLYFNYNQLTSFTQCLRWTQSRNSRLCAPVKTRYVSNGTTPPVSLCPLTLPSLPPAYSTTDTFASFSDARGWYSNWISWLCNWICSIYICFCRLRINKINRQIK